MLDKKLILVTGASRGIGRACAKHLAKNGAQLILLSRSISEMKSLSAEISKSSYPEPILYPFNLCSATLTDYDDLRRTIEDKFGRLDGLIHNAGILGALSPIEHYDIQTWYQVLQVNLNSTFILTQAMIPLLKKSPNGSIIFTLSDVSHEAKANWGAYSVASHGCRAMMQMLAKECKNVSNVRVNAIQPHKVNTKLRNEAYPAEDKSSLVSPEDIVKDYAYLMSDESINCSGTIITSEALADCVPD